MAFNNGGVISDPPKTSFGHNEYQNEVDRIDTLATSPEVTLESFADLDEKKILRKVRKAPRVWRTYKISHTNLKELT